MPTTSARLQLVLVLMLSVAATLGTTSGARASENAAAAQADDGPWVRALFDPAGAFTGFEASVAIDAPVETVWALLLDFPSYARWNPRVTQTSAQTEKDGTVLLTYRLGGGPFSDSATFRVTLDAAARTLDARHESGALKGTRYRYALSARSDGCAVRATGVTRDFSPALAFDDDLHSLLIGVNLASVHEDMRHLKRASEARARAR